MSGDGPPTKRFKQIKLDFGANRRTTQNERYAQLTSVYFCIEIFTAMETVTT